MARIRTIKPEFWTDERIVDLTPFARLLFIGLWNFADDQGYVADKPRQLKMQVLPGDDVNADALVAELVAAGLVDRWHAGDTPLLRIRGFGRHQTIKNPGLPRYPNAQPSDGSPDRTPALPQPYPTPTPAVEEDYPNPGARKGRERKEASPPRASVVDVHEVDALFAPLGRAPDSRIRRRCITIAQRYGPATVAVLVRRVTEAKPREPMAYLYSIVTDEDTVTDAAEEARLEQIAADARAADAARVRRLKQAAGIVD